MKKDYTCQVCRVDTRKNKIDFYMVQDHLWEQYGAGEKMLCLGCFKDRLGREYVKEDFIDCFLNYFVNPFVIKIMEISEEDKALFLRKQREEKDLAKKERKKKYC